MSEYYNNRRELGSEFDGSPDVYDVLVDGYTTAATATAAGAVLQRLQLLQGASVTANTIFTASAAASTTLTAAALLDVGSNYIGQVAIPLSGNMAGQGRYISAYNGTTQITVTPAWAASPGTVTFVIVPSALKIVYDILMGGDGVPVWPAAAAPANGVSFAEALRAIYDDTNAIAADVVDTKEGKLQIFEKSITAAANAGGTTVATITTQPCIIEGVVIHADAGQTADMTSCAVEGGGSQVVEFIGTDVAIQANLDTADDQVSWTGLVRLAATKTTEIDLQGTGATATDLTVVVVYRACVDGGYLT